MMYIRHPLSLRQVEDLLFERGIVICHETVRFWWNPFGPMFAAEIRKRRVHHRSYSQWRPHLVEMFVRVNGKTQYLWRAVDHEGEALEVFATNRQVRIRPTAPTVRNGGIFCMIYMLSIWIVTGGSSFPTPRSNANHEIDGVSRLNHGGLRVTTTMHK
jgi:hypothetical protein